MPVLLALLCATLCATAAPDAAAQQPRPPAGPGAAPSATPPSTTQVPLPPGSAATGGPGYFGPPTGLPTAPPPVPQNGPGNFCFQPAGICGPACSVSCMDYRTAFCSSGLGGAPGSGTTGSGGLPPLGSLNPGAGSSCVGPPTCKCR